MSFLEDILFVVSSALLTPVLLLLVVSLGVSLVALGGFLRELAGRGREQARWRAVQRDATALSSIRRTELPRTLQPLVMNLPARPPEQMKLELGRRLADIEDALARRVELQSVLCKVGPMLGLAGTLIPLGPALRGLQAGNLDALGGNLAVAFTAVVVGLAVAGVNYWMATVRKRWYLRDLKALEDVATILVGSAAERPTVSRAAVDAVEERTAAHVG